MDDQYRATPLSTEYPASPAFSMSSDPEPPRSSDSARMYRLLWILGILMALLIVPSIVQRIQYAVTYGQRRAEVDAATEGLAKLDDLNLVGMATAFRLVAQKSGPSVVHIRTAMGPVPHWPIDERAFLQGRRPDRPLGQGSGVIVDEAGYIVTNNHVVVGANEITVQLSDGRQVDAEIIGADGLTDIAVLKIDAGDLIAAPWGDTAQLDVGDMVWAIGSPFGLDRSVTFGIVSAKGRQGAASPHQLYLQTDAAVNPGNSGGPLVNLHGEIIGINTAIIGEKYQGVSFAIPSNLANEVYERLKETGKVARGWLGVRLMELTPDRARQLGLPTSDGVMIAHRDRNGPGVVPGSPAARAGLQDGDVILKWNGEPATDPSVLSRLVAATVIGSTAEVTIFRDGLERTIEVVVEERPAEL